MTVKLVWATPEADRLVAYMARVSAPENQGNDATAPRLIGYLIRNRHWSPFEMVSACVEIETTRDIGRQLLRHRSFSFQEFCVAGNTAVSFELPRLLRRGVRTAKTLTIAELWDKWHNGAAPIRDRWGNERRIPQKERIAQMLIRIFDEQTGEFTTSHIRDIFQTGVKQTFRVLLENGREIECTKEHKFLTKSGFMPLEDAVGLEMVNGRAVMTKPHTMLACNGAPAYSDKEWLAAAKGRAIAAKTGLAGIAQEAGCTTHTVRKWLSKHGLQFTKQEVASYTSVWNKGKSGYRLSPHSMATIEKMRSRARKGAASNLWRGGADRSERLKIADWCNANRTAFLKASGYTCAKCGQRGGKLELHHILPVAERPDLGREPSNIAVLCRECHQATHALRGDAKVWRERGRGHTLTVHWSKVRKIEFVGEQMTYDLEVEHGSHNYVGNGIVVHNSQRYASVEALPSAPLRWARLQDAKNRQASTPTSDAALLEGWEQRQRAARDAATDAYAWALDNGIAKEVARAVLPEGLTMSRLYMAGTLRSWLHFCDLRRGNGTQLETRELADGVWDILKEACPVICGAWEAVGS